MFIKIKFVNEDPGEWGELRAYGAQWVRRINRTEVKRGVRSESSVQLVTRENLARVVDIEDLDLPVNARKHLPQWPRPYRPTYDEELRKGPALLGNDQHIEIF